MRWFNPLLVWTQPSIGTKTSRVIKTIQYGTVTISNGNTSGTATLGTAVTVALTAVHYLGTTVQNSTANEQFARVTLTNTTTVTGTRSGSAGESIVGFVAVEYW